MAEITAILLLLYVLGAFIVGATDRNFLALYFQAPFILLLVLLGIAALISTHDDKPHRTPAKEDDSATRRSS